MNKLIHARGLSDSLEAIGDRVLGKGDLAKKQKSDLIGLLTDVREFTSEKQQDVSDLMDELDNAKNPEDLGKAQIKYRKKLTGGGKSDTKTNPKDPLGILQ